jgi:cytochrome P450
MAGAVDLTDLDLWARGTPYAEFARLRREAPVSWCAEPSPNSGFWSVTRYADIVAASRDVATFPSGRGVSLEEPTDEGMAARRTIIDADPPGHTKLRKIVSGSFTQRAVAVYRHVVAGLTGLWEPIACQRARQAAERLVLMGLVGSVGLMVGARGLMDGWRRRLAKIDADVWFTGEP